MRVTVRPNRPNRPMLAEGRRRRGFTLVELIIALVLLSLLATTGLVAYVTTQDAAGDELTLVQLTAIAKQTLAAPAAAATVSTSNDDTQSQLAALVTGEGLPSGWSLAGDDGLAPIGPDDVRVLQVAVGPQATLHVAAVTPSGRCANVLAVESGAVDRQITAMPPSFEGCLDASVVDLDDGTVDDDGDRTLDNDNLPPEDRFFAVTPWTDPDGEAYTDPLQARGTPGWLFRTGETTTYAAGQLLEVDVMAASGTGAVYRWVDDRNFWLTHIEADQLVTDVYIDAVRIRVDTRPYACPGQPHPRTTLSLSWSTGTVTVSGFASYDGATCSDDGQRVTYTLSGEDEHGDTHGEATRGGIAGMAGSDGLVSPDPIAALNVGWQWREPIAADPDLFPARHTADGVPDIDAGMLSISSRPGPTAYEVGTSTVANPADDQVTWTDTGSDAREQTIDVDPPTDRTTYYFVRALQLDGTYTAPVAAPAPVPGQTVDLTSTDGPEPGTATIIWPAVAEATGYLIFHDDSGGFLTDDDGNTLIVSEPTDADDLGDGYGSDTTWYSYTTSLAGTHRIVARTDYPGGWTTGRAGVPEAIGLEYWLRQGRTRDVGDWSSWTTGAWANTNCSVSSLNLSQTECQKRTRTRSWNAWSSWSSFAWSSCSTSQTTTFERQCQPRTRTIGSWSSWSYSSWSWSSCSTIDSYTTRRSCRSRTRTWDSWSYTSWAWSSCSVSTSSTFRRQCRSRTRTWDSWSYTSWAYSSCSTSTSSTWRRECRSRTRSRSLVWSSWSGWSYTSWSFSNSCWASGSSGSFRRQCQGQHRRGSTVLSTGSWGYSNCHPFTISATDTWWCRSRSASRYQYYTSWSSWSYGSWSSSSNCSANSGGTFERSCRSRSRGRTGWSYTSWSASSSCSATSGGTEWTQRQCRSRSRGRTGWSYTDWSTSTNCSATSGGTEWTQRQCRRATRTRSYSSWSTGSSGYVNCSYASGNVSPQRQCRNRTRSMSSWGSWSTGAWSLTSSCTRSPTSTREEQCRDRTRTRSYPDWDTIAWGSQMKRASCDKTQSSGRYETDDDIEWWRWNYLPTTSASDADATGQRRCRWIELE